MLPDMSDAFAGWEQVVTLREVDKGTVDFVPYVNYYDRDISAVIQVADKERIKVENVDWSLRYIQVHSTEELFVGQVIIYNDVSYKIITDANYSDYGFSDVFAEEVKGIPPMDGDS